MQEKRAFGVYFTFFCFFLFKNLHELKRRCIFELSTNYNNNKILKMATQRKIYIVSGSEDGNLAVCTNVKEAYKVASSYLSFDGSNIKENYYFVAKEIKEYGIITCNRDDNDYCKCTITLFYTNTF